MGRSFQIATRARRGYGETFRIPTMEKGYVDLHYKEGDYGVTYRLPIGEEKMAIVSFLYLLGWL